MSKLKTRRDIDKAVGHLMEFDGHDPKWAERMQLVIEDHLDEVADMLEISIDEVCDVFLSDELHHMTFGFLFEAYATFRWDDDGSLIETYLRQRGWREAPAGRNYLQALATSKLKIWEITGVKPGHYVELREWATKKKPFRIKEKLASEGLQKWDGLAARVLKTNEGRVFSGAMLPLTPEVAGFAYAELNEELDTMEEYQDEAAAESDVEITAAERQAMIEEGKNVEVTSVTFRHWAIDYYDRAFGAPPEIHNMDGELISVSELHYPILSSPKKVIGKLDKVRELERDGSDTCWIWLPETDKTLNDAEQISVLGFIRITDKKLELETNSVERMERGQALLQDALGNMVGNPLAVHNNFNEFDDDILLNDEADMPPEIQEAIAAQLTTHYRNTLDEPIPMLNGKTPRECAGDSKLRPEVIAWLKYMDNMDHRSPSAGYDFGWMWEELGLEREKFQVEDL